MKTLVNEASRGNQVPQQTMTTILGVDRDETYVPAIELLGRLRFKGNRLTLAHVDPPVGIVMPPSATVYDFSSHDELAARIKLQGEALLADARYMARVAGLEEGLEAFYAVGHTSDVLMRLADESGCALVAVGSTHHTSLGCFLLGSVGRSLAIASHRSFMVVREARKRTGPVRALFATDHSEYSARCFQTFLDWKPQGLEHMTIVTAAEHSIESKQAHDLGIDMSSLYSRTAIETHLEEQGARMVSKCRDQGISVEFKLVASHPVEAIRASMHESDSDLLILGARGHGWLERLFIGSLALHAVVAEPYSTLVLRVS